MMRPNFANLKSFEYPDDYLLKLKGIIHDEEMKHPASSDENNDRCLMVIKRGRATGLTIGRANEICSYVREGYSKYGVYGTSKEWTIIPCDSKHGPFSLAGDSGSVIVDGQGRIGGLLTGG
ncbi:uncharacterized protein PHACADRAFT_52020, partial [Phanerochaete carnosa HHB-10118-sp]